jgi:hypothetical protein
LLLVVSLNVALAETTTASDPTQQRIVRVGQAREQPLRFTRDVIPALTKAGGNSGACHGSFQGRGGFPLSLLGFDAAFDYDVLTNDRADHACRRRLLPRHLFHDCRSDLGKRHPRRHARPLHAAHQTDRHFGEMIRGPGRVSIPSCPRANARLAAKRAISDRQSHADRRALSQADRRNIANLARDAIGTSRIDRAVLDELFRLSHDHQKPLIGLVFCKTADHAQVRLAQSWPTGSRVGRMRDEFTTERARTNQTM